MRSALASCTAALALSLAAGPASAQHHLSVELRAPDTLHERDRASLTALVHGAGPHPLLVTPTSEGTALEVVRGRLLRAEAVDPDADTLEFRVPVVALGPGTAVVRVVASGYACERRCRPVHAETSLVVQVAPALRDAQKQSSDPHDTTTRAPYRDRVHLAPALRDAQKQSSDPHDTTTRAPNRDLVQVAPAPRDAQKPSGDANDTTPRGGKQDDATEPANDPGSAPSDARERTSSLSWVRLPGAETCLSSAQLARAVEERLARHVFVSAADAALAVEGRAERTEHGFRAVLQVSEADGTVLGERTLEREGDACDALGRLVALTVAIMIDPLTAPEPADASTPDDDHAPAEPQVIVRTIEVSVPVAPPPAPRWRIEIDSAILGALGLLPTPTLGGLTSVIVEPPSFIPIVLEGALLPFSRAEANGGPHADFLQVHAGLQLCPLALRDRGLALHGCLGADAGGVFVLGSDVPLDERERVIGQAHVALRGHWDVIGPLTIRLALHLLVPFRHEAFTYGGGASSLYMPEYVAGMLDLGAGVHFD